MKQFILLALVVLATVYAEEEEDKPQRSGPTVYVNLQEAKKAEDFQFNFAIAHVEELNEEEVTIYRIVARPPWKGGLTLEETRFNVTLKTSDGELEEFKQWWEENKRGRDGQTRPFPTQEFTSALIGDVSIDNVSCEDRGYYLVNYGEKPEPRRIPRRGQFLLKVKGCPERIVRGGIKLKE